MESDTSSYQLEADSAIRDLLLEFECQPILFVGSGLSKRYFGAPNWLELLGIIFERTGKSKEDFEYYRQKFNNDPIEIGDVLSEIIFE